MNPLIATYTNEVKNYCDEQFFKNLFTLSFQECGVHDVLVVDNTPSLRYARKLYLKFKEEGWKNFDLKHEVVTREPRVSLFQRNVADSANACRQVFLKNEKYDHLLVIESDVIPPVDLVERLYKTASTLPDWGAIGALYYKGFHDYNLIGVHKTNHVLSGCTLYNRKMIEKYPFRYDETSLRQFPDFWMCWDAKNEFGFYNDHDIHCDHLHTTSGMRQSKSL